MESEQKL